MHPVDMLLILLIEVVPMRRDNDFQSKPSLPILLSFKSSEFLLFSLVFSFFLFLGFRVFQFFSCLSSCVTHATAFFSYENRD